MFGFLRRTFVSLSIRNYRLFFMGQGISLVGTWIQRTTMGWFVYRITGSALLLGLVSFLSMIPSVPISPFVGAWADRWNRHHTIIITQTAFFIQNSLLAIMVLGGRINQNVHYPLLIFALLQGIIEAVDAPIRQNLVIDLVGDKSMIPNAIATNSAMFNAARLVGPALGGFLIILFSEGICFALNALSYIPVIFTLCLIRIAYPAIKPERDSTLKKILDGWRYVYRNVPIRFLLANLSIYTLFGMSYTTLIPIFAKDILKGNSGTQGLLMSTAGIGALTGSLILASRKSIKGMVERLVYIGCGVSLAMMVFSRSQSLPFSMFMMLFIGFGMMMTMATTNTLIQSIVSDEMRGRVLSAYTMAFMSTSPFGGLILGALSSKIGAQSTMMISAGICMLWSLGALKYVQRFSRRILRMLVLNDNASIYRAPRMRLVK
ncbi:MAG TPA: MFS transporter [Candidatus Cloacimonadota bacterium]|nr:MFS transporter [Candidatus Cloacimonadota bacterium]